MSTPSCRECGRVLAVGEVAFTEEWKALDLSGVSHLRIEYTCEPCELGE